MDFDPDLIFNPAFALHTPGEAIDIMVPHDRHARIKGIPDNHSFQFIEAEYMKQDEYDEFLHDTTAFISKYLPRVFGPLAPLASLPLSVLFGYAGLPESGASFITERSAHCHGEIPQIGPALSSPW